MTAIAPRQEQIDTVLLTYWLEAGSSRRTSEITGVPASTIEGWVKRHADRLHELREQNAAAYDRSISAKAEGIQVQAFEVIARLVEKVDQDLTNGQVKNPDQAAQRLATVLGIVTDKWLLLQGRPTHIIDNKDASEHMRSLQQRFPWLVVDSTAEEEPTPKPDLQR